MRILHFIAKQILQGILVMVGVVVVIFILFNILPVNSARMTLGQRSDAASVRAVERVFRLNLPWQQRLGYYFNDVLPLSFHNLDDKNAVSFVDKSEVNYKRLFTVGNTTVVLKPPYLGRSYQSHRKVAELLIEKMYPTAVLALAAMLIAAIIGIVMGAVAAVNQYSVYDNVVLVLSVLGISQPAYFSAILLAMVFGYYLSTYTGLNVQGSLIDLNDRGEVVTVWKNLLLPMIALGIRPVGIITQLTRSSMLDVLGQDYIRTARAKGLSRQKVIFKHALRNAMNPVITSISGWLAALLTGAYFIEKIFKYDGLGSTTIDALLNFDFPVVMGSVLLVAFVFIGMNILTDILYSIVDPRVQ